MARVTYYVVQPFAPGKGGRLVGQLPVQAQSTGHAERMARKLAEKGAAIAFSRSGDPTTGDYDDAVVIGIFGELPEDALEAMAA